MMTDFNHPDWSDNDAVLNDVLRRADTAVLGAVKAAMRDDGLAAILRIPLPGDKRRRRRPPRSSASTAPEQPVHSSR